ncbi:hypothetical protein DFQ29_000617 [Apophysomyces sp. BC1021]|nr:hypothetical protein DFQ29_000617 [Apophysomyces sp. BC1021]
MAFVDHVLFLLIQFLLLTLGSNKVVRLLFGDYIPPGFTAYRHQLFYPQLTFSIVLSSSCTLFLLVFGEITDWFSKAMDTTISCLLHKLDLVGLHVSFHHRRKRTIRWLLVDRVGDLSGQYNRHVSEREYGDAENMYEQTQRIIQDKKEARAILLRQQVPESKAKADLLAMEIQQLEGLVIHIKSDLDELARAKVLASTL